MHAKHRLEGNAEKQILNTVEGETKMKDKIDQNTLGDATTLAILAVAGSLLLAADLAGAQEALEEVIVTARKRTENVTEVPDSIVVLTADRIERARITSVKDIGLLTPNVGSRNDLSPTSTFISVRGINQTRNTDPAVSIVVDGVQISNASQVRQELFDIEQIEVLKGPQGSLYGRNAIAGAINIRTKKTSDKHSGTFSIGAGNANSFDARFALSGPMNDSGLSYRLSGIYHDDEGTIKNTFLNQNVDFRESKTIRGRVIYDNDTRFRSDVRFNWDDLKGGNYYYAITRPIGDPFRGKHENSNDFSFTPQSNPISVAFGEIKDLSWFWEYDFANELTLSSITAFNETYERYGRVGEGVGGDGPGDLDFTPPEILGNEQTYDIESLSQELRLASSGDTKYPWMVGLYYIGLDRKDTLPVYVDFNGDGNINDDIAAGAIISPLGTGRNIDAIAAFANADFDLSDSITLSLGLRYDREDREQRDFDNSDPATNFLSETFDEVQPKASLRYLAEGGGMVYLTVSRGFRSGGFNAPRSPFPTVFKSETLWSYEAGHKGRYANDKIFLNLAVFYQDIKNRQDFTFDVAQAAQILYNIPKSNSTGVEVDVTFQATEILRLGVALGWMDSEIKEFANADLFPVNTDPTIGGASGLQLPVTDDFFKGNKLPNFSHWSALFSVDVDKPINSNWTFVGHADWAVRGDNYWDVFNTDKEKDVSILNASIGIEGEQWGFNVWGTNLTDEAYWSNWFNAQNTALPDIGYRAPERRVGAAVTFTFE